MKAIQTELHRHLDVSLRIGTLLELAQARGFEPTSTSVDGFREKFIMKTPMADLGTVLAQFSLFQKVLDRPEVLERVAFETVEDCRNEGTRQVELRFSPRFVCQYSQLSWEVALDSFEAGMKRALAKYPDMKAGLICIASRDLGIDQVYKTVDFFLKNRTRFLAVDLAGDEKHYPGAQFEKAFQIAKDAGANITIHAGEGAGPDRVWEAIELLGAKRIGHGIASIQDPALMKHLAENQICLEVCPTSNWLTNAVTEMKNHPLPILLRAGVPVCINTDDPGIFGSYLPNEIRICREVLGMSEAEIDQCFAHAAKATFLK